MQEKEVYPTPAPSLLMLFLKATGLALLFTSIMLFVSALIVVGYIYSRLKVFSSEAGVPLSTFYSEIKSNWEVSPAKQDNGHITFLLLGLDSVEGRGDVPPLTDTLLLASLNLQNKKISLLALPRDIWNDPYKTKINALYAYGQERYPDRPQQFPEEVLSETTGVPIHHTVAISMDMVAEIIDTLGGLPITVEESFTDPLFPRPGVDVAKEKDPEKLYMTVSFEKGAQTFTGEQALTFMRSRHSTGETGTDTDRNKRQYLVLQALATKIQDRTVVTNPVTMGKLYTVYNKYFSAELPFSELVRIGTALLKDTQLPTLETVQISASSKDKTALLYNPPVRTTKNQWMYVIQDPNKFKTFVRTQLYE